MGRVTGKVAMVTGAASGLGEAVTVLLAKEGARVAVAVIADTQGQLVVDAIRQAGGGALYVHLDVSQEAEWQAAMYCAHEKLPIRVNSVHPGTCVTPLVKTYYDSQPPEVLQA
ncbi:MAG: 3-beta hydroxysteroid dehydrogenase [Deltaproteobacteria bacterium]|nr:3-beta hydroxysteroid dehydrogenase [Deltaproteobacteria bacterium]